MATVMATAMAATTVAMTETKTLAATMMKGAKTTINLKGQQKK